MPNIKKKYKTTVQLLLFTLPALFFLFLFIIYPAINGILISFTSWNGISAATPWVGFKNYAGLANDKEFAGAFLFTLKLTIFNVVTCNVTGLLLAVLLHAKVRGSSLFRTLFFLPYVIAIVVSSFFWSFIFTHVFNKLYEISGIIIFGWSWFGEPILTFIMILIISIWISSGYLMIIYLAGLKNIDGQLVDAAKIDGAQGSKLFWHIQFPLLMPAVVIGVFLMTLVSLQGFDLVYTLTKGGPYGTTQTISFNVYREAFAHYKYGLASAKSVVLFLIVMIITFLEVYYLKRREVQV